ncbi:hypothetical protein F5887DRAFT_12935 [Amanita rubescens]|nr:hypothetical protein F5887DRAFT_12935 [Amanita rubescens]
MVTLKKRWGLGLLIRGIVWAIKKIAGAVQRARHWAKVAHEAIKRKSESKHVQTAVKHADRGRKVAKGANKASNNMPNNPPPNNGPNNGPNHGHRRRSLLDPRDEQIYKMKRSLVHQKRGLNRRMMRQLQERRSNTGFDELD